MTFTGLFYIFNHDIFHLSIHGTQTVYGMLACCLRMLVRAVILTLLDPWLRLHHFACDRLRYVQKMVGKAVNVIEYRLLIVVLWLIDLHFHSLKLYYYIIVPVIVPVPYNRL